MKDKKSYKLCTKILDDIFKDKCRRIRYFPTPKNYGYDIQVFAVTNGGTLYKLGIMISKDNMIYEDAADVYAYQLDKLNNQCLQDNVQPIYMVYNSMTKDYHIYDILSLHINDVKLGRSSTQQSYKQMYIPYKYARYAGYYTEQKQVRKERRNYNTDKVRKVRKDKGQKRGQYAPRTYKVVRTVQRSDKGKHHDFSNYYNRKQEQSNKEIDITN